MIRHHTIVVAALTVAFVAVAASGPPGEVRDLAPADRAYLDKILGKGVVGDALPAEPIAEILSTFEKGAGRKVIRREVHGKNKGREFTASLEKLERADGVLAWRLDTGGKTVLYGQFEPDGSMNRFAADDRDEGVLTQYDPPIPEFRPHLPVGEKVVVDTSIKVFDLANPGKLMHSGRMKITMEHIGRFRVTVPAGSFETEAVKWTMIGEVGPARVEDQSYWFFDKEYGPVAWVNETEVSAFLLYQDHTKRASVLVRVAED